MDIYEQRKREALLGLGLPRRSRVVAEPQFVFAPQGEPHAEVLWTEGKLVVLLDPRDPPFLSVGPEEVRVRGEVVEDNQRLYDAIVELVGYLKTK